MGTIGETITLDDLERDPYPWYERLREDEPVSFVPAVGLWLVTRWDDVREVDLTPEVFTAATEPSTLNRTLGPNMLGLDGAEHAFLRAAFEPRFRPKAARSFTETTLPELADGLLDELGGEDRADLLTRYAEPLSIRALQRFLDMDPIDEDDLRRWYQGLITGVANFEGDPAKQAIADRAADEFGEALRPLLRDRRSDPRDDVLSAFVAVEVEGRRLTDEEIVANLRLVWTGGMNEPRDLITLTLYALLTHPDALAQVRADPAALLPRAVEETTRWISPVGTSTRQTTCRTSLRGIELEEGALVAAVLASANRDPRHWDEPDRFRLDRPRTQHLGFAIGAHHCIGAWLGKRIATVGVASVLARLPGLALDGEVEVEGWEFRGPTALPVTWSG
jgi:cytochrome P450